MKKSSFLGQTSCPVLLTQGGLNTAHGCSKDSEHTHSPHALLLLNNFHLSLRGSASWPHGLEFFIFVSEG